MHYRKRMSVKQILEVADMLEGLPLSDGPVAAHVRRSLVAGLRETPKEAWAVMYALYKHFEAEEKLA